MKNARIAAGLSAFGAPEEIRTPDPLVRSQRAGGGEALEHEVDIFRKGKEGAERAGLSQTQLARICGLSGTMISCMERGKSAGSEKVLIAVARAFGVRPEWLRSGSGRREGDFPVLPNAVSQPFPERLRQLRKEAGLSQRRLANFVGVSTSAVSCWETVAREVPAGNNLITLAQALGLDPAEVMEVGGKKATPRNEVQLLAAFRALPEERQLEAIKLVEALI